MGIEEHSEPVERFEGAGLPARIDRYGRLADWNRRLSVFLLTSLVGLGLSLGLVWRLWAGYEIRTGYVILSEDQLVDLGRARMLSRPDDAVARAFVSHFVTEAFRVTTDRRQVEEDYAASIHRTMGAARNRLIGYFKDERNPFHLLGEGRSVEIPRLSVQALKVNDRTFLVQFVEIERRDGLPTAGRETDVTVTLDFEGDETTRREAEHGHNNFRIWVTEVYVDSRDRDVTQLLRQWKESES